jgi:hypothetical protein
MIVSFAVADKVIWVMGDHDPHPAIGRDRKSLTDLPRLSRTD